MAREGVYIFVATIVAVLVGCGSSGSTNGDAGGCADACVAPDTDAGSNGTTDGAASDSGANDSGGNDGGGNDAGACPASCTTDVDCNACPQPKFGGWSCNGGVCRFMG